MPKPFDLLAEFGKFGLDRKLSLRDASAKVAFGAHVAASVDQALADHTLLHGQRVEAMFEALLISLGKFQLLKTEDGGRVFPVGRFRVPDFRVVLDTGEHWLIEVKNVYEDDAFKQRRRLMSGAYREALEAYAAATGADLKLAVFWARWSIWTLVSPTRMADASGDVVLDMPTAMRVNELGLLGEMTIGTRPPLRLRLTMDSARTSPIGPDGMVEATIAGAALFCDTVEIVDPVEQQIAWIFMQYGEWVERQVEVVVEGERLVAVDFRWEPEEQVNVGFEFIGSLSRMFARHYAEQTIKDREVVQIRVPLQPDWFGPLTRSDHVGKALPLWRFTLRPNFDAASVPSAAGG